MSNSSAHVRAHQNVLFVALLMLAVAAAGYIGLRLTCVIDGVMHATVFHLIPFIAAGAITGGLARRIYHW